jgi:hypothetical protein
MQDKPVMTTINGRPAKVAHLRNIDGAYVQCKLPNGDDAYVPLSEICQLFQDELLSKFPSQKESNA